MQAIYFHFQFFVFFFIFVESDLVNFLSKQIESCTDNNK